MMKKKIVVVYGGYSSEKDISKESADGVCSFIDKEKYDVFPVLISKEKWCAVVGNKEYPVSKGDFSFIIDNTKIVPDCVYNTIHGTPGEDGTFQGYLKMLGIPHTSCDVFTAALTFNKEACKSFLTPFGYQSAEAFHIQDNPWWSVLDLDSLVKFPCIVKPNSGGSSVGISKVYKFDDLEPAINKAHQESNAALVEEFIDGMEITCGLYKVNDEIIFLPPTLIVSENDFFDFDAKYSKGKSREITPAPIDKSLLNELQSNSESIYDLLNCKGFIRIDYIVKEEEEGKGIEENIFLLEVNSNPGMTSRSIIPQQIAAKGLNIKDVFTDIIEDSIRCK